MSMHQMLIASYANPLLLCDSADFDGTNDYMTRGAALDGIADSKSGILSAWIRLDGGDGVAASIMSSATPFPLQVIRQGTNAFQVIGRNAAGSTILSFSSTSTFTAAATWLHVLASWNLAVAGTGRLYINDAVEYSETTYTDDTIDYNGAANWSIGAGTTGSGKLDGCLAEYYFAAGQYLDFSNVYQRRKFISASGKPVYLGADGSVPTGTAPTVYQRVADGAAVATFATNLGSGGDFSITGTLATGSTSPSD